MRNLMLRNHKAAGAVKPTDFGSKVNCTFPTTRASASRSSATTTTTLQQVTLDRQKPSNSLGGISTGLGWEVWLSLTSALVQTVHAPTYCATNHTGSSSNYLYQINHGP